VTAADAEFAEPVADARHVGGGPRLLISRHGLGQVGDGLVVVSLAGQQDTEIFRGGGLCPQVVVLCGRRGELHGVTGQQAEAVRRGSGNTGNAWVTTGEDVGRTHHVRGQTVLASRQCGANQPRRDPRFAQQDPRAGRQNGTDLTDVADSGGRTRACPGGLSVDHAGRGPRVDRGRIRHRGGLAGEVLGRGGEVALAQRDQGDQALASSGWTWRASADTPPPRRAA
jgi:hypothetical protein